MAPEEAGDEDASGPPPHPLDRPWVHPSELVGSRRPPPRPARSKHGREIFLALGAGVIGALAMVMVLAAAGLLNESPDSGRTLELTRDPADPDAAASMAAAASTSVVGILVTTPMGVRRVSGVCVRNGQVITSAHAFDGATAITVVEADGARASATVIGQDPATQLALVRVDGNSDLEPAKVAANGDLQVGEWILALGGSDGAGPWVAAGVVASVGGWNTSGTGTPTAGLISIDAATPPEARGGALLDRQGHVVGVLAGATSDGMGGLATPIATVRDVAAQLAAKGEAAHGSLGVRAVDEDHPRGARVESVVDGSAAAKAGIAATDVVVKVDGTPIRNVADLVVAVRLHQPGDRVQVTINRKQKARKMTVVLGAAEITEGAEPASVVSTG